MAARDVGQLFQINDQTTWLHDSLTVEGFGLGSDRFLNTLKVFDAAERDLPTKLLELAAELRVRSSDQCHKFFTTIECK